MSGNKVGGTPLVISNPRKSSKISLGFKVRFKAGANLISTYFVSGPLGVIVSNRPYTLFLFRARCKVQVGLDENPEFSYVTSVRNRISYMCLSCCLMPNLRSSW